MVRAICQREYGLLGSNIVINRAGSGFKLRVRNLKSLSLILGEHTTSPLVSIGVSVDYQEFVTANVTAGLNNIPVSSFLNDKEMDTNVIRINAEGWQNNRVNLESIVLNAVRIFYFVYYDS